MCFILLYVCCPLICLLHCVCHYILHYISQSHCFITFPFIDIPWPVDCWLEGVSCGHVFNLSMLNVWWHSSEDYMKLFLTPCLSESFCGLLKQSFLQPSDLFCFVSWRKVVNRWWVAFFGSHVQFWEALWFLLTGGLFVF